MYVWNFFIYRPNEIGFDDWISDIPFARRIITDYEGEWDSVIKFQNHDEYQRAYRYYKRYREFKATLSLELACHIVYKLWNGNWRYDFSIEIKNKLIEKWLPIECLNKESHIERISNNEIVAPIKEARKISCYTRREVAELIGRRDYSNTCIVCGKPLTYCDNKQPKRFCCDACRTKWWNANRDLSKRKTAVKKICPICGKEFYSYKKTQDFCSQECFSSTKNNNDIK